MANQWPLLVDFGINVDPFCQDMQRAITVRVEQISKGGTVGAGALGAWAVGAGQHEGMWYC